MRAHAPLGIVCVVAASLAACSTVLGFDDLTSGSGKDAGTDGAAEAGAVLPITDASGLPDATVNDAGVDGNDALPKAPVHPPSSIRFTDRDKGVGAVLGNVVLGAAKDESDVTAYNLYWGTDPTTKLSAIATLAKEGGTLEYRLSGAPPPGATHILAFAANGDGEMASGVAVSPVDTAYADISTAVNSGDEPSALIDPTNGKLLVVTNFDNGWRVPGLFRCAVNSPDGGADCTFFDISAGRGDRSGTSPSTVFDTANNRLLVVTDNSDNNQTPARPGLFRCDAPGADGGPTVTFFDVSAAQGRNNGGAPSAVIDTINQKLLVVTRHDYGTNEFKPGLLRCELSGSPCAFVDIAAGQANGSGQDPSAVIDTTSGTLLVVTDNSANYNRPGLFRCALSSLDGGTSCSYTDISDGQGQYSGLSPSAVIDVTNQKLLVVTRNGANDSRLGLFRCNLDGTGCAYVDISAGRGPFSGVHPSAVIDTLHAKLLVAATDGENDNKLGLFRCKLDGRECTYTDLSAGQGSSSGVSPSAVIDGVTKRLLVVTANSSIVGSATGLFSVGLW